MMYGPETPADAIGAAVLTAARKWDTEAVAAYPTGMEDGDAVVKIWVFEIVGRHQHGWNLFGREALAVVDLDTLAVEMEHAR